jgi:diaminopimelate decarboxylase
MRILSSSILALSTIVALAPCAAFSPVGFRSRNSVGMAMANPEKSVFLTPETAKACIDIAGGSPLYAYSLEKLNEAADACLAFPNAYGLTVRYAMKASPNSSILKFFNSKGIHIDASSGYEVRRAIAAGIPAENISLSTQELPSDFKELVDLGIKVNAW